MLVVIFIFNMSFESIIKSYNNEGFYSHEGEHLYQTGEALKSQYYHLLQGWTDLHWLGQPRSIPSMSSPSVLVGCCCSIFDFLCSILSFCPFSTGHFIICFSNYDFWYLQTFLTIYDIKINKVYSEKEHVIYMNIKNGVVFIW